MPRPFVGEGEEKGPGTYGLRMRYYKPIPGDRIFVGFPLHTLVY